MGYDIAPGITTEDKKNVLKFVREKDLVCIYEHDPKFLGSKVLLDPKNNIVCGEKFASKNEIAYQINL
jgi:hypothetical protein